jgi:membrane-associated phospholipid phosphatase
VAAAFALTLVTADALGAEPPPPGPVTPPIELRHDFRIDLPVTAALAASVVTVAVATDDLQGTECRWCDGAVPGDVNGLDDAFRSSLRRLDTSPANVIGHVLAFGVAPATAIVTTALASAADRRGDGLFVDLTLVAEGALSATLVSEVTQRLVLRERPYVHALGGAEARAGALAEPDSLRSFPSLHTTTAFALAASAGTIASMRGYRLAPLVWTAGLMLGVAVGYARIAADREYLTDTLAGAGIGVLVGGGVPYLFHRPRAGGPTLTTYAVPGGRVASVSWLF